MKIKVGISSNTIIRVINIQDRSSSWNYATSRKRKWRSEFNSSDPFTYEYKIFLFPIFPFISNHDLSYLFKAAVQRIAYIIELIKIISRDFLPLSILSNLYMPINRVISDRVIGCSWCQFLQLELQFKFDAIIKPMLSVCSCIKIPWD